jgi:hypothetical protein
MRDGLQRMKNVYTIKCILMIVEGLDEKDKGVPEEAQRAVPESYCLIR